jgi:uncharacterized protein YjbI with pentapeptide repeats
MRSADLGGAELSSADLTNADLSRTGLVETDFTNAHDYRLSYLRSFCLERDLGGHCPT